MQLWGRVSDPPQSCGEDGAGADRPGAERSMLSSPFVRAAGGKDGCGEAPLPSQGRLHPWPRMCACKASEISILIKVTLEKHEQ